MRGTFLFGAIVFIIGGALATLHGTGKDALLGPPIFVGGWVMLAVHIWVSINERQAEKLLQYLNLNRDALCSQGLPYRNKRLRPTTVLARYYLVVSAYRFSFRFGSRFYVVGAEPRFIAAFGYSFWSLLFGWWGLPWGPIWTLKAVGQNLSGGEQCTVGSLIQITAADYLGPRPEVTAGLPVAAELATPEAPAKSSGWGLRLAAAVIVLGALAAGGMYAWGYRAAGTKPRRPAQSAPATATARPPPPLGGDAAPAPHVGPLWTYVGPRPVRQVIVSDLGREFLIVDEKATEFLPVDTTRAVRSLPGGLVAASEGLLVSQLDGASTLTLWDYRNGERLGAAPIDRETKALAMTAAGMDVYALGRRLQRWRTLKDELPLKEGTPAAFGGHYLAVTDPYETLWVLSRERLVTGPAREPSRLADVPLTITPSTVVGARSNGLVLVSANGKVTAWHAKWRSDLPPPVTPELPVTGIALAPETRRACFTFGTDFVEVWDLKTSRRLVRHSEGQVVTQAVFRYDEQLLLVAGNRVQLWALQTLLQEAAANGTGAVVAATPRPPPAAPVVVRPKPPPPPKPAAPLVGPLPARWELKTTRPVRQASFRPDGKHLLTVDAMSVRLFAVGSDLPLRSLPGSLAAINEQGRIVTKLDDVPKLEVWDFNEGTRLATAAADADVKALAISPDGTRVFALGQRLQHWQLGGEVLAEGKAVAFSGHALTVTSDGKNLHLLGGIRLGACSAAAPREPTDFPLALGPNAAFADLRSGAIAYGTGWRFFVWSGTPPAAPHRFEVTGSKLTGFAVAPNEQLVCVTTGNETIQLWDLPTGNCLLRYQNDAVVTQVAFSPSGEDLLLVGADRLRLFRVADLLAAAAPAAGPAAPASP